MFKRLKKEVIFLFVTYIGSYLLLKEHLFLLQAAADSPDGLSDHVTAPRPVPPCLSTRGRPRATSGG